MDLLRANCEKEPCSSAHTLVSIRRGPEGETNVVCPDWGQPAIYPQAVPHGAVAGLTARLPQAYRANCGFWPAALPNAWKADGRRCVRVTWSSSHADFSCELVRDVALGVRSAHEAISLEVAQILASGPCSPAEFLVHPRQLCHDFRSILPT